MKELKELVAKIANQELQEVLRGFNLNKFKSLEISWKMYEYAKKHLPFLGQGTSRAVFALSGNKVLKIAHGKILAGVAQNEQEVNLFTNPKTKSIVTKIYDVADDYTWIISEIAKPFTSEIDFFRKTGVIADLMDEFVDFITPGNFEKSCESYAHILWSESEDFGYFIPDPSEEIDSYEEAAEWCKTNLKGTVAEHAVDLVALGSARGDLGPYDHWGVTSDGRVVVIDYGLTRKILRNFYR